MGKIRKMRYFSENLSNNKRKIDFETQHIQNIRHGAQNKTYFKDILILVQNRSKFAKIAPRRGRKFRGWFCGFSEKKLDPPRKARARSPNLQRTGLIGSVTSRDVTKSVNVFLARWFHFFDAKPKNVHFWCPKVGSRYRPLEWLIQLTSIFFRVPQNLSVKLPKSSNAVHPHRCCTGKSDYNPDEEEANTKLHPARSLQSDVKSASRKKWIRKIIETGPVSIRSPKLHW